jgi:FdhD protein
MADIQITSNRLAVTKLDGGQFIQTDADIIIEQELALYVNGTRLATASLAPGMEKEFAAGYLFGQGFINSADDIESIKIENGAALVALKKDLVSPAASYRIVSGGGRSAYFSEAKISKIKSGITINKQDIFRAMNTLFEKATLYKETEGAHAAGLFDTKTEPICIVEDIGRHNTLDKVCGYCLLKKINTSKTFLVSTGRMASEMVTKICRAGIPIAATKTAVTDKGLEIADRYGLTLIGFVRDAGNQINTDMDVRIIKDAGMKIYCGGDKIRCE